MDKFLPSSIVRKMPTPKNIKALVNMAERKCCMAVIKSSSVLVILCRICIMEMSGIRLQANKSATKRVRILMRKVLGMVVRPPCGKK
jgi:hypothetical protein